MDTLTMCEYIDSIQNDDELLTRVLDTVENDEDLTASEINIFEGIVLQLIGHRIAGHMNNANINHLFNEDSKYI